MTIQESQERDLCNRNELLRRFEIWVHKISEETGAAVRGLLGDEHRSREGVIYEEYEERERIKLKVRWAVDFKPVLEVELEEETVRKYVEADVHELWLALLRVYIPMQLFELELGRGHSERLHRRIIIDEEIASRRTLLSLSTEGVTVTNLLECAGEELSYRKVILDDELDRREILHRGIHSKKTNALLRTYLSLVKDAPNSGNENNNSFNSDLVSLSASFRHNADTTSTPSTAGYESPTSPKSVVSGGSRGVNFPTQSVDKERSSDWWAAPAPSIADNDDDEYTPSCYSPLWARGSVSSGWGGSFKPTSPVGSVASIRNNGGVGTPVRSFAQSSFSLDLPPPSSFPTASSTAKSAALAARRPSVTTPTSVKPTVSASKNWWE